ncbi:MAG: glucose-6-phosphate dehydrogenase (NADP(+)), partial [Clostridia bacterium]|nr:glucose-6-phosphate dehydrogenase (NADP(+)) [Clostridia bacterium]
MDNTKDLESGLMLLFGTTGDLAARKLFPALKMLHDRGDLPAAAAVLGIGRRPWDDRTYRDRIAAAVRTAAGNPSAEVPAEFLDRFHYHAMDMRDVSAYDALRTHADGLSVSRGLGPNRLFFLATAPDLFPVIADNIGRTHLARAGGFRRLLIEKPFGRDLATARQFNDSLYLWFDEREIYRIDHYLGKEMLQNILVLRFSNRLFEPVWNREHIDHVQVSVRETGGVELRAGYYDQAGALRDMVQNHLLQLLALLAMERPTCFEPECVRDEKVKVLRSLRLSGPGDAVLGQYAES